MAEYPIKLYVTKPPSKGVSWYKTKPGRMWKCSWPMHVIENRNQCYIIRLPETAWVFHTNESESGSGVFWDISGKPPRITIHPSINVGPEIWHGWIQNGEMHL